jgi:glycosyltransferase involved in cell wall biosynthesis
MHDTDTEIRVLALNGAYRAQRVTGQQRYAHEIARELLDRPAVVELAPPSRFRQKAALWAWVQTGLPIAARGRPLLSLTARAPAVAPHHIVTIHDLFPITHPEWYSRQYVAVHQPLLRHHLRSAEMIVTVSEPVAEQIRARSTRDVDVVVAPNAPSAIFAARQDGRPADNVLRRCGVSARAHGYLLAVASMDPRKNLHQLVQAHGLLPDNLQSGYPLVLVGGEHGSFRGGSVTASANVLRAGYVSDAELAALYQQASAVVLPSLDEGFGLPAVEAAAAGARLAVSDIEVFRWVCGEDAEYFDPREIESIRDALMTLLTVPRGHDPEQLAAAVRRRFDWAASAAAIRNAVNNRYGS